MSAVDQIRLGYLGSIWRKAPDPLDAWWTSCLEQQRPPPMLHLIGPTFRAGTCPSTRRASRGQAGKRGGHRAVSRLAMPYSNPSIDTLAVVISVGHRISVRPFATAIFCVPLTE